MNATAIDSQKGTVRALTAEEIAKAKTECVAQGTPVRFLANGCAFNISTGDTQAKGINVIHQRHYWCFSRETALWIAKATGTRPVFSQDEEKLVSQAAA